jgi:hypothetical protein
MEEGYVPDFAHGVVLVPRWFAGVPEISTWYGVKTRGKSGYARWCGKGEAARLPPIPIKRGNVVARRLLAREKTASQAMLPPASCPPAP